MFDEQECRERRAGDCAEGVAAVEQREAAASGVGIRGDRARCGGERAAHEKCRHDQHERGEHEAHERSHRAAEHHRAAGRGVRVAHEPHERGGERGGECDEHFEISVKQERLFRLLAPAPEIRAAESEPAHENPEHGRRGCGRCAEDQPEFAQPRGLINERAQPRAEKQLGHRFLPEVFHGSPSQAQNACRDSAPSPMQDWRQAGKFSYPKSS